MRKILFILTKLIKIHNIVHTKYLNFISKLRQSYVMLSHRTFPVFCYDFFNSSPSQAYSAKGAEASQGSQKLQNRHYKRRFFNH